MPLSEADNELLTRVEGDAPMGSFLRENFWVPAGLTQLLVADGAPQRVQLLGRRYVAFRSTDGRLGFFNEGCPHRGVSLALARNVDNALRCIFHGWKFRVDGTVVECPTLPGNQETFCKTVPLKHYPIREAGGIYWVWLGSGEPKRFPEFEFTNLSGVHIHATYQTLKYNWIQHIEGQVDSSHISVLHQDWLKTGTTGSADLPAATADLAPVYEIDDVPGGFRCAAIRKVDVDKRYVRITSFIAPWYSFVAFGKGTCVITVPIDDDTSGLFMVHYDSSGPLEPSWNAPAEKPWDFPPYLEVGAEGRWGQDRGAMKRGSFSGFPKHIIQEDYAVGESQGSRTARTHEYLNAADRAVMHLRRSLLNAVKAFAVGAETSLTAHDSIAYPQVRANGKIIPDTGDWRKLVE